MKPCEVCGKSHHLHTENDLSNCLVWANDDNRRLKAEIERLRDAIRAHRSSIWGVREVEHPEDIELYGVLAKEEDTE